ncbi:MAG: hypothetical protein KF718_22985 [Polyangiaceae bacterium]|nr:hypothetical protein [Polyangiaceae bacterium]
MGLKTEDRLGQRLRAVLAAPDDRAVGRRERVLRGAFYRHPEPHAAPPSTSPAADHRPWGSRHR